MKYLVKVKDKCCILRFGEATSESAEPRSVNDLLMPKDSMTCSEPAPAHSVKPPIHRKLSKNTILMDSGGSPENCQKVIKISKIDDFGGPSENPRKIVLGSLKIVKKCQNIVLWATKILFFDNNIVAASGRSQKRGGGLRPPPLCWTILLPKNSISVAKKTRF